jgi:hypothetical protein
VRVIAGVGIDLAVKISEYKAGLNFDLPRFNANARTGRTDDQETSMKRFSHSLGRQVPSDENRWIKPLPDKILLSP